MKGNHMKDVPHDNSRYQNYGCRCQLCKAHHAAVQRAWKAKAEAARLAAEAARMAAEARALTQLNS